MVIFWERITAWSIFLKGLQFFLYSYIMRLKFLKTKLFFFPLSKRCEKYSDKIKGSDFFLKNKTVQKKCLPLKKGSKWVPSRKNNRPYWADIIKLVLINIVLLSLDNDKWSRNQFQVSCEHCWWIWYDICTYCSKHFARVRYFDKQKRISGFQLD